VFRETRIVEGFFTTDDSYTSRRRTRSGYSTRRLFRAIAMASKHGPSHLLEGHTVSESAADPPSFANTTYCTASLVLATAPVLGGTCVIVELTGVQYPDGWVRNLTRELLLYSPGAVPYALI
jgi:hypothetical protein